MLRKISVNSKKRLISLLFVLVFMLSVSVSTSLFTSFFNSNNVANLEGSSLNTLYNGKSYPFELTDVYDDENNSKIYTAGYLQTEIFNSTTSDWNGTVVEDEVSVVNNTNYKSPSVDGHYPATHSFENDVIGSNPEGWTCTETGGTIEVIEELDGHTKVLEFYDDDIENSISAINSFTLQTDGTIEFWWAHNTDASWTEYLSMSFRESGANRIRLIFSYRAIGRIVSYNGTDYIIIDEGLAINTFFHIKLIFNDTANMFDCFVGGVDKGSFDYMSNSVTGIDDVVINTRTNGADYWHYLDALGYSGDPDYDVGDNLYSEPISMLNGTFDNTNNMKSNDDSNSEFTSTEVGLPPNEYIDSITYTKGSDGGGSIPNTYDDDANFQQINTIRTWEDPPGFWKYWVDITLVFDPVPGGRDFFISAHIDSGTGTICALYINGGSWKSGTNIDFDDGFYAGVNSVRYTAIRAGTDFNTKIYYFKMVEDVAGVPAVLNFTVDLNFNEVDTSKLLALDISSHHYTNVSQTIVGNVYDYDSSSYTQMFSSDNIAETENYFVDETSVDDYLDGSGNLRLKFNGTNFATDFKLSIDYIRVRFYYKMDITIDKTFYINGLWRYRFKLIGSLHYTDWTVFEVIDPPPNFYAISESDLTTRWILQGAEISAVEDFHDDISGDYWNLVDVSENYFQKFISESSNYLLDNISISTDDEFQYSGTRFDMGAEDTSPIGLGWDGSYFWGVGTATDEVYKYTSAGVYTGTHFDVGTEDVSPTDITWDGSYFWVVGMATDEVYKYTSAGVYTGTHFDVGTEIESPIGIIWDGTYFWVADIYTDKVYKYEPKYNISKNYFGSGYTYMQTNTSESISLESIDYGTHYNLSSGDYFEIDFQTNSDSKIELILLKDDAVNKTLTLSQSGNTNFDRHTTKISVDEFVEFDQLKISGTLEDTDYIKVFDIKTKKYTLTGDYADFYVGSKRDREVYLTPDIYNLRIFEEGDEKVNENITIPATGVLDYVYTPIERLECRIALFNTMDESLEFTDYHITVNRSLNDIYSEFWLIEPIFSVDEETYIYISVYDRFDTLIDTFERLASEYIDLELEVYSLQIKNLMTQRTTLDINGTHVYPLLSGDSMYFTLSEAYYVIGYYDTNEVYKQFTIYLNSNQAYELNRSKICFLSYSDQQGTHLFFENYKTYINSSLLYENMFYREIGDNIGIEIKDRYGISIKNETYTVVSGDNYIPITLTMYSLKVMSQQLCFNHINITRDPVYYASEMYWSEWIAPGEIIDFRLFAGYYKINITNNEDGAYSYYSYTLSGDDVLLISSNNTLYNVLVNIANVNTTIGNQITNVQIDLTNQNSNINNTIINIEINLSNVNSTLGTLLTNIETSISNINSSIVSEIVSLSTDITNINSSITNEILSISTEITNINTSIISQLLTLGVDISNINGSIINQIVSLGVDVTNINTSLSNQILSIGVDISNLDTSITNQILLMVADIENVNSTIYNQTLVMLADISNTNSTLLNQMISLGVDVTNINASIINQILLMSVDLTNINSSISNLLTNIDISITTLQSEIETFYTFTNTSFINLNNVMNTSFINIENNIFTINTSISNLVVGVSNDIYLINGTISTMISSLENNLLLMNVSIDTALFSLGTTLDLIGVNITSNYILLNNSINLTNVNVNDSRIAIINNLLLINNTMSTLIADVYSAVYLVNNSIYTAVVDLGAYLGIMNNTISGNLSIVLEQNEFLTEIYQMTMFSELLNWTDIGLNTSLLTSQIDTWEFINNYKNQSVEIHLRYQDIIDNLTVSAQNTLEQYLPKNGTEYREWSVDLQEYVGEWKPLPENRTVPFGFYEEVVPDIPDFNAPNTVLMIVLILMACGSAIALVGYLAYRYRKRSENYRRSYADKISLESQSIRKFSQGTRVK